MTNDSSCQTVIKHGESDSININIEVAILGVPYVFTWYDEKEWYVMKTSEKGDFEMGHVYPDRKNDTSPNNVPDKIYNSSHTTVKGDEK